ncbi:MAG: hypothetical protein V3R97_00490, partial [Gemmatimonadales bacterium]
MKVGVAGVVFIGATGLWLAPAVGAQELNPAPPAAKQDTVRLIEELPDQVVPAQQRPVSPMGAFWRSLLIPG